MWLPGFVSPSLFAVVNPRAAAGGGVWRDSEAVCPLFAILCQGGIMQAERGVERQRGAEEGGGVWGLGRRGDGGHSKDGGRLRAAGIGAGEDLLP